MGAFSILLHRKKGRGMKKKAIVWIVLAVVAVACVIAVVSKQKSGVEGIAAVYGT